MNYKNRIYIILAMFIVIFSMTCTYSAAGEADTWVFKFSMGAGKNNLPLNNPQTLFVDSASERYYISDSGNNRLLSFDKNGEPLHSFDANGKLERPIAMVKKGKTALHILEKGKGSITRINLKTREVEPLYITFNNERLFPHRIKQTGSVTIILDKISGDLFTVDNGFTTAKIINCSGCSSFVDMEVHNDVIYALTEQEGRVFTFSLAGKPLGEIVLDPRPDFPVSLAIDNNKNIFVLERHKAQISVFSPKGKIKYRFLEKGAKEGQLYYPIDMQFDPWGRLCIVEEGNGRVSVYHH